MFGLIRRKTTKKNLRGGESARVGTLNVKCPNMDCGTAGLPGFHATWSKPGGSKSKQNNKTTKYQFKKQKKVVKNKKSSLKGGDSARIGTLNVKCPNMDCGTAGLPGFHATWNKSGGSSKKTKNKKNIPKYPKKQKIKK